MYHVRHRTIPPHKTEPVYSSGDPAVITGVLVGAVLFSEIWPSGLEVVSEDGTVTNGATWLREGADHPSL